MATRFQVTFDAAEPRRLAERLVAAGATRIAAHDEPDQYWVVLQDPEGNEFCLD